MLRGYFPVYSLRQNEKSFIFAETPVVRDKRLTDKRVRYFATLPIMKSWVFAPYARWEELCKDMAFDYDVYVKKYSDNFRRVRIDQGYLQEIKELAEKIVSVKNTESHHKVDHNQEIKRFTTGLMGEAAVEMLLGIKIIDWTIGDSAGYHHPDIPGYNVGIKTVEKNKFPVIFKENTYPQIICIRSDKYDDLVFVCGLATPDVLNRYQSDELILDYNLRKRGTKTGFWGFEHLSPVTGLADLEPYRKH